MALDLTPQVSCAVLGSVDPTGSPEYHLFKVPAACKAVVLGVSVINATARAVHATDINTFTLNRIRAASATAIGAVSTIDVGGTALEADVPLAIALTSDALSELNAGDVLQLVCTEGAVDMDLTEVSVFVEWLCGTGIGQ